eukprot:UN19461
MNFRSECFNFYRNEKITKFDNQNGNKNFLRTKMKMKNFSREQKFSPFSEKFSLENSAQ